MFVKISQNHRPEESLLFSNLNCPSIADREKLKERTKAFDKSENDLKALQSVGQIVGEVLKQLTEDKCKS